MASSTIAAPTAGLTDERVAYRRLLALGPQHVLVMYASAMAVSLIVGGALYLPKEQLAFLINTDLFAVGLATPIQTFGTWKFSIRIPVMIGVTFASVGPTIAIDMDPSIDLLDIYGTVIVTGLLGIVITPFMGRMLGLFPSVMTGTIITLISMPLMGVDINWTVSDQPTMRTMVGGVFKIMPSPAYGDLSDLGIALVVLVIILLLTKYGRGLIGNIAVLLGIAIDILIAMAFGRVSFAGITKTD